MPKDNRTPVPEAANRILDEAKMNLAQQQEFLREIIKGGLSDAEIFRRLAALTDLSHKVVSLVNQAQSVGRNGKNKEQEWRLHTP